LRNSLCLCHNITLVTRTYHEYPKQLSQTDTNFKLFIFTPLTSMLKSRKIRIYYTRNTSYFFGQLVHKFKEFVVSYISSGIEIIRKENSRTPFCILGSCFFH